MTEKRDKVSAVLADEVIVRCSTRQSLKFVRALGGSRTILRRSKWRLPYDDESELAELMSSLRDAGFAFGGAPHGWPPAAVFAHLREKGLIEGRYVEVVSTGDGEILTER